MTTGDGVPCRSQFIGEVRLHLYGGLEWHRVQILVKLRHLRIGADSAFPNDLKHELYIFQSQVTYHNTWGIINNVCLVAMEV